ncbi:hypothetical protein QQM39_19780 [Streptomyces sp. DT2A-34]|uniref:hypothetical protein n=1 Tax=Streptomyces sp. DT2A-34 TaxID=3051182 RepID=UPI00265C2905|nr:hypothetical protein [Streptomyces sp. DT2A-34]MDO0913008.1 hypothetical protein [Streptomyces sp. DT2A-34]
MSENVCGARQLVFSRRPPIGPTHTPCTLAAGHQGDHIDATGGTWSGGAVRHMGDAELELTLQWRTIARKLDKLYAAQRAGDRSAYLASRITRLECLQQALLGNPSALAA